MQLGKKLATGFVTDDAQVTQVTAAEEASLAADGVDAKAPESSSSAPPEPEPAAAS
jgi:hypothetical protein